MDGVGTPIIGRPRPLPSHDTPNPAHNTYTLKCEEPLMSRSHIVAIRCIGSWFAQFSAEVTVRLLGACMRVSPGPGAPTGRKRVSGSIGRPVLEAGESRDNGASIHVLCGVEPFP